MKRILSAAVLGAFLAGCQGPAGPAGKDGASGDGTRYTLTATASTGGTISPSGAVMVDSGNLQMFVAKPDVFYRLDSVTADGARLQVTQIQIGYSAYVLNVSKDMEVRAWFSLRPVHYGMKLISGGTFSMGSMNGYGDEQPVHSVTVSSFYMDTTEVTQAEYAGLMGTNPSAFSSAAGWETRPVENLTWFDAVLYCNARSRSEGRDTVYSYVGINGIAGYGCSGLGSLAMDFAKNGYRLPTEAEWEYACRAGSATDYYWGGSYPPATAADTLAMDNNAVWWHNSNFSTARVGTKLANAFGLYDMSGNVW
ncbi:MAG: SUMF1/EgtB/PvdO family nonheme iron enzyme, partial [Chitinispirillaceae bacterium]|nr:SUMF1/EgtB/PvdO family nonheme iron enzyme [Chitinispirillaceae bacterium]